MHSTGGKRSGFSLVEVLISISMLVIMIGTVGLTVRSGSRAFRTGQTVANLDANTRRFVDRICERLQTTSRAEATPTPETPFSSTVVDYQSAATVGFGLGWGDLERIELRVSPGDADDGVDNDGNGLIDERQVIWTINPGLADESEQVLCSRVAEFLEGELENGLDDNDNGLIDEGGLSFDFGDNSVTVRLTCQARDPGGFLIESTVQRTIAFRNQGTAP